MYSVVILMSTYNGDRFLKSQIESLLLQFGVKVSILVRDDGSKDDTLQILKEYADKYDNFSYYTSSNLGPALSFLDLVKNAPLADYYAFCDQDDVWDKDKLLCAVDKLEKLDNKLPNLYYSNLKIVDEDLKFYRMAHSGDFFNENKYSALTECLCTGCTMVFNRKAKELLTEHMPKYCSMHDTWVYLVCKIFGKVVYDTNAHIQYRQHKNNVVGTYLSKGNLYVYKQKIVDIFKPNKNLRYDNVLNFYQCYKNYFSSNDLCKVEKIINYNKGIRNKIILLLDKDISSSSFYGTLKFKMHVILGRL